VLLRYHRVLSVLCIVCVGCVCVCVCGDGKRGVGGECVALGGRGINNKKSDAKRHDERNE